MCETLAMFPNHLLSTIEHFFVHYKDLEEGKWVRTRWLGGCGEARAEYWKLRWQVSARRVRQRPGDLPTLKDGGDRRVEKHHA